MLLSFWLQSSSKVAPRRPRSFELEELEICDLESQDTQPNPPDKRHTGVKDVRGGNVVPWP